MNRPDADKSNQKRDIKDIAQSTAFEIQKLQCPETLLVGWGKTGHAIIGMLTTALREYGESECLRVLKKDAEYWQDLIKTLRHEADAEGFQRGDASGYRRGGR